MLILQVWTCEMGKIGDLPTVTETISGRVRTLKPIIFLAHDVATS